MNLRNSLLIFLATMVALVPLKICAGLFTLTFVESAVFTILFLAAIAGIIVCLSFSEIRIRNMDISKNVWLGSISALISVAFFFCISAYFNDTSRYDFEWQPVSMSLLSILCCITFALNAATFFTGKNMLSGVPFFIFCPTLWFGMSMVLFLSIYNNNADVYEIMMTAFLSLFAIYHTQVFATSSKYNIVKQMFIFGMPSILLIFAKCIPTIIKYFNGSQVSNLSMAVSTLEFLIALYIIAVLAESYKQLNAPKEPEVRSITIH